MRGFGRGIGLTLCGAAALLGAWAPLASAACPNEAIRQAQGDTALPSCMALELLSPPKKFGQEATELGAFSPGGTRALFKSKAALADSEGLQSFIGDNYVGLLGTGGWSTVATSPPESANIQLGGGNFGGPYAFTSDFGKWVLLGATKAEQFPAEGRFFTDGLSSSFAPLSPLLSPINNTGESIQTEIPEIAPADGNSAELSLSVFSTFFSGTAYLPEDPRVVNPDRNSYLVFRDSGGQPALRQLAREGTGPVYGGRCGTRLGNGSLNQGAISPDGSRIYFSTRPDQPPSVGTAGPPCDTANPLRIMVREDAMADDATVDPLFTGGSGSGDDLYQGASLDSSKVFLASPRKLAASDQDATAEACSSTPGASKGCDLYLYDHSLPVSERLIQVSAGDSSDPEPGKGADVLTSTIAISPDGSHVYFVAQGVLTTVANPDGDSATLGEPNLYLYDRDAAPGNRTSFLGTLVDEDQGRLWGLGRSFGNGAYAVPLAGSPQGGDGHVLFFTSKAPLLAGADDGGLADIFRYDADAETLQCATCDPALPATDMAAGPNEALEVSPSSNFAVQGRWASEDGQTMVFATVPPALAPGVPYIWKEGQATELPGDVRQETPATRPVVSMGGEVAGFTTTEALLPQDGDTARDVYLVRVNGGFLPPPPPVLCNPLLEGNCQGPPSTAPPLSPPNSEAPGPGNVKPPKPCKKGQVRKKGKCKPKPKPKKHKQGKGKKRAANKSQGGSK